MEDLFQKLKRKSRKSSSTSSEEDNRPSEDKRSKFDLSEEDCGIDESPFSTRNGGRRVV